MPDEPKRLTSEPWILGGLFASTTVLALALHLLGRATWLEAAAFVSGALCVWLTVKESLWNFPISMLNVAAVCFVFFGVGLYADATLQIVYFILSAIGWYMWLHGGQHRSQLRITRLEKFEAFIVAMVGIVLTIALTLVLRWVGGSTTFWDALTTSLSLCAQWLLNRKKIESWHCWIAVDVIYVPLYAYKELYLTSILYMVFLAMATMGLLQWRKTWRQHQAKDRHEHSLDPYAAAGSP